jgi:hypothetical protein
LDAGALFVFQSSQQQQSLEDIEKRRNKNLPRLACLLAAVNSRGTPKPTLMGGGGGGGRGVKSVAPALSRLTALLLQKRSCASSTASTTTTTGGSKSTSHVAPPPLVVVSEETTQNSNISIYRPGKVYWLKTFNTYPVFYQSGYG